MSENRTTSARSSSSILNKNPNIDNIAQLIKMFGFEAMKGRAKFGEGLQNFNMQYEHINRNVSDHTKYLTYMAKQYQQRGDVSNSDKLRECTQSLCDMQVLLHNNYLREHESVSQRSGDAAREMRELKGQLKYKEEGYDQLKERNHSLEEVNMQLSHNVDELMTRISQMMSSQEVDRKDAHENLMDKNRPSAIVQRCRCLYREQYGEISAEMQDATYDEKSLAENLLKILMMAMKKTKKKVEQSKADILEKLQNVFNEKPFKPTGKKRALSKHLIDDVCMMLREIPDENMMKEIQQEIYERCLQIADHGGNMAAHLSNYINECVQVTWLMNASNPPMYISSDDKLYSVEKHSKFSGHGNQVDYYLWPCLYFSEEIYKENGNVMAKGDVVLLSSKKPKQVIVRDQRPVKENEQKEGVARNMKSIEHRDQRECENKKRHGVGETEQRYPARTIKDLAQDSLKNKNKPDTMEEQRGCANATGNYVNIVKDAYPVVPPICTQPDGHENDARKKVPPSTNPGRVVYDNGGSFAVPVPGPTSSTTTAGKSNRHSPYNVSLKCTPAYQTSPDNPLLPSTSASLYPKLENINSIDAAQAARELEQWDQSRAEEYVVLEQPTIPIDVEKNVRQHNPPSYSSVTSSRVGGNPKY